MVVIDTSAWIEWFVSSPAADEMQTCFDDRDRIIVPTIVQLEFSKWVRRERGGDSSDMLLGYLQRCRIVDLDTAIALAAADLCRTARLATADAIIYATALEHDVELLTCDRHFEGLPGVRFVEKRR